MKEFKIEKFIEFIADLVNEFAIFDEGEIDSKLYFQNGGCYELYKVVKHYFPNCQCMIRKDNNHCAILYNGEIFDVNGKINTPSDYVIANQNDIEYMEDRFGLHIKELETENIILEMDKCRIKGILYE